MKQTKDTDEQFTIRELVVHRGLGFTVALFKGTSITIPRIQDVYTGRPITDEDFKTIQKVLKERMTSD
jgi:hypothetical protein